MTKNAKRAAIFAFYDAEGTVDDYVLYLAKAMKQECNWQIVVVNGELTAASRQRLEPFADEIIIKENKGYDVSCYKAGYLSLLNSTEKYDEIVFYNSSCYGPVFPFNEMFDAMLCKELDFWGLTIHTGAPKSTWDEKSAIPVHIQSYFFVVREKMFYSSDFAQYWSTLPDLLGYWDAVAKHEVMFTRHFEVLGYSWAVYINTEELAAINDYALVGMPEYLLRTKRCPLIKRKSFIYPRFLYQSVPHGGAASSAFNFIKENTDYPITLITQNLTRTVNIYDTTSATASIFNTDNYCNAPNCSVTAIYFITNENFVMPIQERINPICKNVIVFKNDSLFRQYSERLQNKAALYCARYEDIFTTLWAQIPKSEFLLLISDEFSPVAERFADATVLWDTIDSLKPEICAQILSQNPETGVLLSTPHTHSDNLCAISSFKNNEEYATLALNTCGVTLKPDFKKPLIIARAGCFFSKMEIWQGFAPKASAYLQNCGIREILPAIIAAQNGYITQYTANFSIVAREMQNENAMLSHLSHFAANDKCQSFDKVCFAYQNALRYFNEAGGGMTLEQAFNSKLTIKQKIYIIKRLFFSKNNSEPK